ncbi:class I SAM-dependent methyltransferase [Amycolatopsis cihanbeyliensis]|uniref:Methyltransferase family protein n=1 Tax=Amycolatopsis cihanbeyliensis TaxID=1128664 RepID=A0A542DEZ3_AMYCI|nr:class I SAM-dependent methyltransferase [Amycolatopsis cihanbeyliensis]TQJ01642.1 methyltransferase family protein [Amycolatopsis cihanbeyliensis]
MVDATRALSFGEIAESYSRYRPGVPAAAMDWLLPDDVDTVVDLAAGTGALTRDLVGRVGCVVAVEPDPRMRKLFARNCPGVQMLPGTAESIPLPNGSADGLLIAMAWHWIDPERAIPEIARVLRTNGTFGVIWNYRDLSVPWVADLDYFTRGVRAGESGRGGARQAARNDVMDPPTGSSFGPLHERHMTWLMTVTAEELVGHLGTDASAIALSAKARRAVDEQVTGYVRDELGLTGNQTIELPMACRCLRATRSPNAAPVYASSDAR